MATTKVRTTFTPDVVLEVQPAELLDLSRSGVLHSFERNDETDALNLGASSKLHKWVPGKAEPVEAGEITGPVLEKKEGE